MKSTDREYTTISIWKPTKQRLKNCIEWAVILAFASIIGGIVGALILTSIDNRSLMLVPNMPAVIKITILTWLFTSPFIWILNSE